MRIAILQTGKNNAGLKGQFDEYPEMFEKLLNTNSKGRDKAFSLTSYMVCDGQFPENSQSYHGYIITGSSAGVYEEHFWIAPLFEFIQKCYQEKTPVCGICFGHQAVAAALGGKVVKWPDGWEVGTHKMQLHDLPVWIDNRSAFSLIYFHQDQVTELPNGAGRLASNAFCEYGGFFIDQHVFCLQGHPEFEQPYSTALLEVIRDKVGNSRTDIALDSLSLANDRERVACWIKDFFRASKSG